MKHGDISMDIPEGLEWDFDLPSWDRFKTGSLIKALAVTDMILIPLIILGFILQSPIAYVSLIALAIAYALEPAILFTASRVYGQVRFRVDRRGVGFVTRSKRWPTFKVLGFILTLMGLVPERFTYHAIGLQGPGTGGAGVGNLILWRDIRQALLYPKDRVVVLKERWFTGGLGGGLRSLHLYCTAENYKTVASIVQKRVENRTRT